MKKQTTMWLSAVAVVLATAMTIVQAQGRMGGGQGAGGFGMGGGQGRGQGPMMGQGRRGGGQGAPGGPVDLMMELSRVGLTDAQRDQVKDLVEADRETSRDAMAQLDEARRALHEAIFAATPQAGTVLQLQQQVSDGETAKLARDVKLQVAVAAILTPEQKAKLEKR